MLRCSGFLPAISLLTWVASWSICSWTDLPGSATQPPKMLDPAAWGSDHVGQPVPEYMTGDECLFCHREDVGQTWALNRHHRTIRQADPDSPALVALYKFPGSSAQAEHVQLVLGHNKRQRFLKPTDAYGQLALLSTGWLPTVGAEPGKLIRTENAHWDMQTFGKSCAGCHATGVDSQTHSFMAPSLDCYVCHGDVTIEHTKNPSLMLLARERHDPARVVISICAQCHVRTGRSRSTGLPYPNNFVPGDNLFRDFQVDFSVESLATANPADRHVLENVRDVVLFGRDETTCLSCHDVHRQSGRKHHRAEGTEICLNCHNATAPKAVRKTYEVHSGTCGY